VGRVNDHENDSNSDDGHMSVDGGSSSKSEMMMVEADGPEVARSREGSMQRSRLRVEGEVE